MKKNIWKLILISFLALGLGACSSDSDSGVKNGATGNRGGNIGTAAVSFNLADYNYLLERAGYGYISSTSTYDAFNAKIKDFLSPMGNLKFDLGYVSPNPNDGNHIYMGMDLALNNQALNLQTVNQNKANAAFLIAIMDDIALNSNGQIPPVYVVMPKGSLKEVRELNGSLDLVFIDGVGKITVSIFQYSSNTVEGIVTYQHNNQTQKVLGNVAMPMETL